MKHLLKLTTILTAILWVGQAAAVTLPVRTEIFQEVPIEEATASIPPGVTQMQSIQIEPAGEDEVIYLLKFDSTAQMDTLPIGKRFAYQDIDRIHIFDFYNAYSAGAMEGTLIRHKPVSGVDKKMFKSSSGAFVLRIAFYCDQTAKVVTEDRGNAIAVHFKTAPQAAPVATAVTTEPVKAGPQKKGGFMRVHKSVFYGMGLVAVLGTSLTYFYGKSKGEDLGREEALNEKPVSHIPPLSNVKVFPDPEE